MSSFSREWIHSLEHEHQIVAERRKTSPNRCRTQQNCTKSLQNAAKLHQIAAERSKTAPNRCRTQQNYPKLMQNAAKLHQIVAERSFSREWAHSLENEFIFQRMSSFSREWAHSLENEHQIVAERSKTTPNRCRTQQNCTKSLQNAAKLPQIFAERSKTAPNRCRTFIL